MSVLYILQREGLHRSSAGVVGYHVSLTALHKAELGEGRGFEFHVEYSFLVFFGRYLFCHRNGGHLSQRSGCRSGGGPKAKESVFHF